jgi:hypothetical protein
MAGKLWINHYCEPPETIVVPTTLEDAFPKIIWVCECGQRWTSFGWSADIIDDTVSDTKLPIWQLTRY